MPLTGIEIGGTPGTGGGTTPVAVPNVVGKLRPQAEALLEDFGFVTEMTVVTAGGTPEEVYAQDPMPPATRPEGSKVRIFVIKNPVPDVDVGKRFTDVDTAVAALDQAVKAVGQSLTDLGGKVDGPVAAKLNEIAQKLDGVASSTATGFRDLNAAVAGLDSAVKAVEQGVGTLGDKVDADVTARLDGISQKLDDLAASSAKARPSKSG